MSDPVPKEVHGLLLSAELAIKEATNRFAAPIVGSPEYSARVELANALYSIEMVKYHIKVIEVELEKTA